MLFPLVQLALLTTAGAKLAFVARIYSPNPKVGTMHRLYVSNLRGEHRREVPIPSGSEPDGWVVWLGRNRLLWAEEMPTGRTELWTSEEPFLTSARAPLASSDMDLIPARFLAAYGFDPPGQPTFIHNDGISDASRWTLDPQTWQLKRAPFPRIQWLARPENASNLTASFLLPGGVWKFDLEDSDMFSMKSTVTSPSGHTTTSEVDLEVSALIYDSVRREVFLRTDGWASIPQGYEYLYRFDPKTARFKQVVDEVGHECFWPDRNVYAAVGERDVSSLGYKGRVVFTRAVIVGNWKTGRALKLPLGVVDCIGVDVRPFLESGIDALILNAPIRKSRVHRGSPTKMKGAQ